MAQGFNRYSLYAANLGGLLLRDLYDYDFQSATKKSVVIPGGSLHPQAIVNCCADPRLSFSTKDFTGVFGGSPTVSMQAGYAINTGSEDPTSAALFQYQARVDGAAFAASGTNSHTLGTSNKGFLYCTDITAQQDDERGAQIKLAYAPLSIDGLTDPVSFNTASTLTSSPLYVGIAFLGPVVLGDPSGSFGSLRGVQSVSIKTGIDYRSPRADGCVFSINGSIHALIPEIRITTKDPAYQSRILANPFGRAFTAGTAFNIYFRKGVHGAGRVANSAAEHFVVKAQTGDDTTDSISVRELDDATCEIIVRPSNQIIPSGM